jgi:serine/threonine-protein kinase
VRGSISVEGAYGERHPTGVGPRKPFFEVERSIAEAQLVDDGTIVLRTFPREGSRDILVVALGDSVPRDFVSTDADENGPALSPNGRWLAYASNGSGRDEGFVRAFPAGDALYPVSSDGGTSRKWAHSGREWFFRSGEGDLMSVDVSAGERLQLSSPHVVTRRAREVTRNYDAFRDDQSFLFMEDDGEGARFILVLNFFEELKLRVTT